MCCDFQRSDADREEAARNALEVVDDNKNTVAHLLIMRGNYDMLENIKTEDFAERNKQGDTPFLAAFRKPYVEGNVTELISSLTTCGMRYSLSLLIPHFYVVCLDRYIKSKLGICVRLGCIKR